MIWTLCVDNLFEETVEIETGDCRKWNRNGINVLLGPDKQTAKPWFGLENRKKISQIIKDYFYLPFFLLIILC